MINGLTSEINAELDQVLQDIAGARPRLLYALRQWRYEMPDALLRAALSVDASDAQAQALQVAVDRIADRQLLPHLHFSRSGQLVGHPLEPTLRTARLRIGLSNQRLRTDRYKVMAHLTKNDVRVLVFKGADLAYSVYPNPCCRIVGDIDLLVAEDSYTKAAEALAAVGWCPKNPLSGSLIGGVLTPGPWSNPDYSVSLDIHGAASHHTSWKGASRAHFAAAVEKDDGIGGVVLGLSPEHGLEQICCHGLAQNFYPPVRWAADAIWILRSAGSAFDWDCLLATARANHSAPILTIALRYLSLVLHADIPERVFQDLRQMPCRETFLSSWSYRLETARSRHDRFASFICRFKERHPDESPLRASLHLPAFLRDSQNASSASHALGVLAIKTILNRFG